MNAEAIIEKLGLEPLSEEGGFYRRTFTSKILMGEAVSSEVSIGTCIYFLVTKEMFSAMHKIESDEIFHYYGGDTVEMLELGENGEGKWCSIGFDIGKGVYPQKHVPKGRWQGLLIKEGGSFGYSLLGCAVTPGFLWKDFTLGDRAVLIQEYPHFSKDIESLTR